MVSYIDSIQTQKVTFTREEQFLPAFCVHSRSGDGFRCLHGVALICKKHGAGSVYEYIARRHVTVSFKSQYENVELRMPSQQQIYKLMQEAR